MEATCEDWGDLARGATAMARWDEASAQRLGQYTPAGQDSNARAADLQTTAYAQKKTHDVWKQVGLLGPACLPLTCPAAVLGCTNRSQHDRCMRHACHTSAF
jgi:hypothetical protein